uniref:Cocaine- and amphetamine-regulated transcript protein n=1 Tax=Oryzias melastigma TaxID=30732 RepID=A0A3B3BTD8_ORYME
MKLKACAVFLLLGCFLWRVACRMPDFTPAAPTLQVRQVLLRHQRSEKNGFLRLPGICRRLKRRRVTVLCNMEKFCWGRSRNRRQKITPGQVCRCPRHSKCSHFFLHSL